MIPNRFDKSSLLQIEQLKARCDYYVETKNKKEVCSVEGFINNNVDMRRMIEDIPNSVKGLEGDIAMF